ncbi:hypothetical protein EV361DRAFT_810097, partial [Lentinula raphanica]
KLTKICKDILNILSKHSIPSAASGQSKVFYHKMMGDYHRYLEFAAQTISSCQGAFDDVFADSEFDTQIGTPLDPSTMSPLSLSSYYPYLMSILHLLHDFL